MVSKGAKLALTLVGYVFMVGESMAPSFATFPRFIAQQAVGPNTPFPYLLMWVNSILQLSYGIRKHDWLAVSVHGVIVGITSLYCFLYVRYIDAAYRKAGYAMLCAIMTIFVGLVAFTEIIVWGGGSASIKTKREQLQGELVVVVTILMYFSPAKEVYDAWKTHEVGGVDILLSLAFLANGIVAMVSACLPFNAFELFGGGLGTVCALGQCCVWLRCHNHNHHNGQQQQQQQNDSAQNHHQQQQQQQINPAQNQQQQQQQINPAQNQHNVELQPVAV